MAALISNSSALSWTPVEAARPWTSGECIACCACSPTAKSPICSPYEQQGQQLPDILHCMVIVATHKWSQVERKVLSEIVAHTEMLISDSMALSQSCGTMDASVSHGVPVYLPAHVWYQIIPSWRACTRTWSGWNLSSELTARFVAWSSHWV